MTTSTLFRLASEMHGLIPYHCSTAGYAFRPWHYYFEVTRRCNLRCKMCQYLGWYEATPVSLQKEGELTTQEWAAVIDQVPRLALITFTGGEPFIRKDFMHLLERASARCRTHFISNGALLTEEQVESCVALAPKRIGGTGLNFVGISIDGPSKVHNDIRGPGTFEKAVRVIRMLSDLRRRSGKRAPLVHVTAVIQEDNVDFLGQMPRIAAEAGALICNLTLETRWLAAIDAANRAPDSYDADEVNLPRLDAARLARGLREARLAARQEDIELRTPRMPDTEIVRYYRGQMALDNFRCGAVWSNLVVDANGNVSPCPLLRGGSVSHNSLKEIWNNARLRELRRLVRKGLLAPCAGCCFLVYRRAAR